MANLKGNGTTIGKFLLIMFAGKTLAMLAAKGINLPVNEVELAGYIGIGLGFIYSLLDSYFKNDYRWTYLKKLLNIFNKEIDEEDDSTTIEPETEDDIDVVGDVIDEDEC